MGCFPKLGFSQETLEVKVIQAQMSQGTQPCYVVEIPEMTLKEVQQNWIKKIQEGMKTKVATAGDELVLSNVVKTEISSDTISLYTLFIEKENRVVMHLFLQRDSVFFSPNEDKTNLASEKTDSGIKKYIRDFAVTQYKLGVSADLGAEQKILEELQKDLEDLEKDNENLEKDISSLENDIDETERSISELEKEIELKNQEILDHTVSMQTVRGELETKAAEDKKKDLDKEKKKLEKDRTQAKDDISEMKARIEKNEKTIEENLGLIEEKKLEISTQEEDVEKAQVLLDGIK
jgi:peptidoglycan hydrolase CwlO-like protein